MNLKPDLSGRLALVTGASRGIGREIALQMAGLGAHVIAVARTAGALEELDDEIRAGGGEATLVPLDLTDFDGVDRLGGVIDERWGKLDILVANAGILGPISPIGHVRAKDFERVMAINVTSTWRLIRSTDPLLRKSDAGRAIILSSGAAHSCKPFWGPYSASKAAVEALARTWAAETEKSALRVNSVNPGATRTRMRAQAMPGEDPQSLPSATEVAAAIVPLAGSAIRQTGQLWDVRGKSWRAYSS
ncbi:SDR family NAD(P)-dependent oxidoreductase [Oricola cellulosilytica]|uniref:SDR family NAD(P)-dependent oxidoreductase n=1 Tax=Oricola cellulosilytica TaxID=1429082 RepID=A0A4V2MNS2_9HYPH|nr:SDR family NAD(P)-dependent oxidoreductase [Oricola cellulosilytica]TCD14287.1 SDR family NAD(P)-dependent oxidoreductase [Oricola cellulosilytica]